MRQEPTLSSRLIIKEKKEEAKSVKNVSKKRACCCFGSGLCSAIIIIVASVLIFYLFSHSTSSTKDVIVAPSKTMFTNPLSGSDYVYLDWEAPQSTGGSFIVSYTLQYKVKTAVNWTNISMASKGLLLHNNVTQLEGSTDYEFRINSFNAFSTSDWSQTLDITTKAPTLPSPPSAPFAIGMAVKKTINLSIAVKAGSNGGAPIDFYSVFYRLANEKRSEWETFCKITFSETPLNMLNCTGTLKKDQVNQIYMFSVTATNRVGTSAKSAITPCFIPPVDSIQYYMCKMEDVPSKMKNSSISVTVAPFEIDIAWLPPSSDSPIISYELQRDDWFYEEPLHTVPILNKGLSLYAQLDGLQPGSPYQIRIRAVNKDGKGEWSDLLVVKTVETEKCGNYNDEIALQEFPPTKYISYYLACSFSSDVEKCIYSELAKDHLSDGCRTCMSQAIYCANTKCSKQCLKSPESDKCGYCVFDNCFGPALEQCGGLPSPFDSDTFDTMWL